MTHTASDALFTAAALTVVAVPLALHSVAVNTTQFPVLGFKEFVGLVAAAVRSAAKHSDPSSARFTQALLASLILVKLVAAVAPASKQSVSARV